MTELEKTVYNSYLRVTRQKQNQPYKLRKDFSDFEQNDKYFYVQKLGQLFTHHPHIKIEDFFAAPYEFYEEKQQYPLDFYTSLKAINVYSLNEKKKMRSNPDEEYQLKFIVRSLNYISLFAKERGISVDNYVNYNSGQIPEFLADIKNRDVSIYVLFGFEKFDSNINNVGSDIVKFILGDDIFETIDLMRTKYLNSKKAKILVKAGVQKIKLENTKQTNTIKL